MKFCVKTFPHAGGLLPTILPDLFADDGMPVHFEPAEKTHIKVGKKEIKIFYANLADGWCAFGDHIFGAPEPTGRGVPVRGVMLDASRGGVPRIDYLKKLLLQLVLCGLNRFCLYTEDVYAVEGEPMIGYGRGAYSFDELRELDDYAADELGVEVFPCIQALGHFEQTLRYKKYMPLRDNPRVLNTSLEATYEFIEKLIVSASAPYRSKRIHLGLDEPWGLGRGESLDFDAPKKSGQRFAEHLARVDTICRKHGLEPIGWGDYVLGHSGETPLTEAEAALIPDDFGLVYWDYETTDPDLYRANINALRKLGYDPICAPTGHAHNRFFPDFEKVERTCRPFAEVMCDEKINESLFTIWGDDGHECLNVFTLPVIIYYLACVRGQCRYPAFFRARCEAISGFNESQLRILSRVTDPAIAVPGHHDIEISGKMLLWDDPMHGFVTRMVPAQVSTMFQEARWNRGDDKFKKGQFGFPEAYCSVICTKVALMHNIMRAYSEGDRCCAAAYAHTIPELIQHIENFALLYRKLWLTERKAFGLEIIDHRFGGLYLRVMYWWKTVLAWCRRECESIPELEDRSIPEGLVTADLAFHNRIYSRCYQLWG